MNDRLLESLKQQHVNINLRYATLIGNILAQATNYNSYDIKKVKISVEE